MIMKGRAISPGFAEGTAVTYPEAFSFLGGVDGSTGDLHVRDGNIAGRVFMFPNGKGSTVGSYVVYDLMVHGKAPLALVNRSAETIVTTGAVISSVPMVDGIDVSLFRDGDEVAVDGSRGYVELKGVDGTPYAESVMGCHFWETDAGETPDGEYVALNFPDDGARLDFFFAPGGYVRCVSGDYEALYQASWEDDNATCAEAIQGRYYAAAEHAGVKPIDASLEPYCGLWYEKIAGRGEINIARSVAPGKVNVAVRWPESAAVADTWEMTARLEDGRLAYENAHWEKNEYDENGGEWQLDSSWEESGYFMLSDAGELIWHNDNADHGGDSTFIQ